MELYCTELRSSEKEEDKLLAKKYFGIWYTKPKIGMLVYKMLYLYIERCKLKHSLAYF